MYDAFAAKLKAAVEALKVGNGMEPGVTQGPLINAEADKPENVVIHGKRRPMSGS